MPVKPGRTAEDTEIAEKRIGGVKFLCDLCVLCVSAVLPGFDPACGTLRGTLRSGRAREEASDADDGD
jgi:hypothetical protein